MHIGRYPEDSENAALESNSLLRHIGILGNSGSGKTVMAKIILEECALAGIPSIILDVQGDLARMAMPTENDPLADSKRQSEWRKVSEVRIWTPVEASGLPICLNPFKMPSPNLSEDETDDESVSAWDRMATGITEILGHDASKNQGKNVKAFLYRLLIKLAIRNSLPSDFGKLADAIGKVDSGDYDDIIKPGLIKQLERDANSLDIGDSNKLYTQGSPLSIPMMLEPRLNSRTPVNVIYLNTLSDENMKMAFIQQFCRELYDWMIQNPSNTEDPQLMVFLDEAGPYIPPDPKMPASKSIIRQLLKQGRKYGIGFMLASQSPGDLDYRTVGQTNTTFLGRFTAPQDIKKVGMILGGMQAEKSIASRLAKLDPGQFLMISSGSEGGAGVKRIDTRRLLTSHGKPLTSDELPGLVSKASREWAKGYSESSSAPRTTKIPKKVRESARASSEQSGRTAESGTPILGGFTHLADNEDPLHVLMGISNGITALTLLLCTYALGNLWADGEISQLPFMISAAVSSLMGLGLTLEFILRNESEFSMKIRSKARFLEGLVLAWIWALWAMETKGVLDLSEWSFMILISQTLLTAFFALEAFHRVRLGRLEFTGVTIVDKMRSGVKGIPGILTGAEINELKVTSEQIHDSFRTFMEIVTVGMLASLLATDLDISTPWVQELVVRIVSLDVALLISKGLASLKKSA